VIAIALALSVASVALGAWDIARRTVALKSAQEQSAAREIAALKERISRLETSLALSRR
jgi:hypothetical protein